MIHHPIPPLFDKNSKVLILGSFPSVKSREVCFFYGHSQNRFWKVLANVFETDEPKTVEEKTKLVLSNKLALWDVIASCEISGSADSSVKNVTPNDLSIILNEAKIEKIFTNGKTSYNLYKKYLERQTGIEAVYLPSTSPANASWSLERLCTSWKKIKSTD